MAEQTTQNSAKIVLHDENGKFAKGHPKVGGIKKGSVSITVKIKRKLQELSMTNNGKTNLDELIGVIMFLAIEQKNESMIRLIWNYLDGAPKQSLEIGDMDKIREEYFEKLDKITNDGEGENKSDSQGNI